MTDRRPEKHWRVMGRWSDHAVFPLCMGVTEEDARHGIIEAIRGYEIHDRRQIESIWLEYYKGSRTKGEWMPVKTLKTSFYKRKVSMSEHHTRRRIYRSQCQTENMGVLVN